MFDQCFLTSNGKTFLDVLSFFLVEAWPQKLKCTSDVHARDPEKTSLHVSSMFSTSHSECHGNASPRKVLAHCGFFCSCFHARISQVWSASCRIQLKHWTTSGKP